LFELADKICYPGAPPRPNEDAVGYGPDYLFVIDGASCLSGLNLMAESDAAWMVEHVTRGLHTYLAMYPEMDTADMLRSILVPLQQQYLQALRDAGVQKPKDSPSAGMAMFRKRGDRLEFFGLGDCVGLAVLPDGSFFYSLDTNLVNLDNQVLEEMVRLHLATGKSMSECRQFDVIKEMLLINRDKKNTPGGYWALDLLNDAGLENAVRHSWEVKGSVTVGAVSDGFAQLAELFGVYGGYGGLFEAMRHTDLSEMFDLLCKLQDEDHDCNDYPRFKLRDDTTAAWGRFEK